jgi:putative endonuclease
LNWHIYIIQNQRGTLYTGITNDPERRLEEHNGSRRGAKATRVGRPWTLLYLEPSVTRSSAAQREYEIKMMTRAQKLALIQAHGQIEKVRRN